MIYYGSVALNQMNLIHKNGVCIKGKEMLFFWKWTKPRKMLCKHFVPNLQNALDLIFFSRDFASSDKITWASGGIAKWCRRISTQFFVYQKFFTTTGTHFKVRQERFTYKIMFTYKIYVSSKRLSGLIPNFPK